MTMKAHLRILVPGAISFLLMACQGVRADEPETVGSAEPSKPAAALAELQKLSDALAYVAEIVKPSVVHIRAVSVNKEMNRELRKMLGDEKYRPMPTTGTGSGIIFDESGYIVTNNHVISDAKKIYVTLADGRKFTAHLIGVDPKTDLAVIKITGDHLKPAKLADSEAARVGELVLAIGSPFRLGHSLSHGIISAIGRSEDSIDVDIAYKNWIQTDAPINPGNSGGPLINIKGEVLGINVAIATETGSHQGVGFSIPSNTVARIATALKNGEKIDRGYLGVLIKPVDDRVADAYGLAEVTGAFIEGVGPESPAFRAGMQAEDIVLAVSGKPVRSQAEFQELISTFKPGAEIPMTVWREHQKNTLLVTVGAQPGGFSTRGSLNGVNTKSTHNDHDGPGADDEDETFSNGRFGELGFEAETVTPALISKLRLDDPESHHGVLITRVDPTSEAYDAGLRPRQIITRINGEAVASVNDLQQLLTTETISKGVRIRYRLEGEDGYFVLRIR